MERQFFSGPTSNKLATRNRNRRIGKVRDREDGEAGESASLSPSATATDRCTSTTAHRGGRTTRAINDDAFGVPDFGAAEFLEPPPPLHAQSSIRRFCQSLSQSVRLQSIRTDCLAVGEKRERGRRPPPPRPGGEGEEYLSGN